MEKCVTTVYNVGGFPNNSLFAALKYAYMVTLKYWTSVKTECFFLKKIDRKTSKQNRNHHNLSCIGQKRDIVATVYRVESIATQSAYTDFKIGQVVVNQLSKLTSQDYHFKPIHLLVLLCIRLNTSI